MFTTLLYALKLHAIKQSLEREMQKLVTHSIRPLPIFKWTARKELFTYLHNFGVLCDSMTYIYYIEGPKQNIIVDTAGVQYRMRSELPAENVQTPEKAFKSVGLTCNDIDIIILTHTIYEHIGNVKMFPNAKCIIQKKELEFAREQSDPSRARYPLWIHWYDAFSKLFLEKGYTTLWGQKSATDQVKLEVIEGDEEIVDGVKIISTPGHSPGTQSVAVRTDKGTAVITGFCCIQENFEPPVIMRMPNDIIGIGQTTNHYEAYDSMLKVKEMADIAIANHDIAHYSHERIPDESYIPRTRKE